MFNIYLIIFLKTHETVGLNLLISKYDWFSDYIKQLFTISTL